MRKDFLVHAGMAIACLATHCIGVIFRVLVGLAIVDHRMRSLVLYERAAASTELHVLKNTLMYHTAPYIVLTCILEAVKMVYEKKHENDAYEYATCEEQTSAYKRFWVAVYASSLVTYALAGARFGGWEIACTMVAHAVAYAIVEFDNPSEDEPTKVPLLQEQTPASQPSSTLC